MGGSGGNFDPTTLRLSIRKLEQSSDNAEYESGVAQLLGDVLANANDRDVAQIQSHVASIQAALDKEIGGVVNLLFGGSISKRTYVDGLSDIDTLVILNDSELATKTPEEVRAYFINRLKERFPQAEVEADGFAVTIRFTEAEIQLVPVKQSGNDYLLPSEDLKTWSRTRPKDFTDQLTALNRDCAGKVIPTIKLAKGLVASLTDNRRPSGYHLENLAVEVFSGYKEPKTPKAMLVHFFREASHRVLTPCVDSTGQSRHVDDNLGKANSLERRVLSDSLGRIGRRLANADGARSLEQWQRLFGVED